MKLFLKKANNKLWQKVNVFFKSSHYSKLFEIKSKLCKEILTEKDLYNSLKSTQNNKSPNNNG